MAGNTTTMDSPSWLKPSTPPRLSSGEVHIWRAALDVDPPTIVELEKTLSSDELDRAREFHFPVHANRFKTARGILRKILASYFPKAKHEISFSQNDCGKPFLAADFPGGGLRFNASHSQGVALYAFALGREVGIDLEYVRPENIDLHLAKRFFSTKEIAEINAASENLRTEKFFHCWTRKEAYAKARGMGLSLPLSSFSVPLDPCLYTPMLIDGAEATSWWVAALAPCEGYVGAIVTECPFVALKLWQWR